MSCWEFDSSSKDNEEHKTLVLWYPQTFPFRRYGAVYDKPVGGLLHHFLIDQTNRIVSWKGWKTQIVYGRWSLQRKGSSSLVSQRLKKYSWTCLFSHSRTEMILVRILRFWYTFKQEGKPKWCWKFRGLLSLWCHLTKIEGKLVVSFVWLPLLMNL